MPIAKRYVTNRGVVPAGSGLQLPMSALYHQSWVNPTTADVDGILTTLAGPNATTFTLLPGNGLNGVFVVGRACVLPFARNVVITVTHASAVVALSGVISGLDIYGKQITEAWSVTAGGTSKTFTGKKAFKAITQITITAATDASTDSVIIGDGVVFGLDAKCSVASGVKELANGSVVTTGTVVAASAASTDDPRGTYAPATAPNGTNDYDLWFISDDPEWSAAPLG